MSPVSFDEDCPNNETFCHVQRRIHCSNDVGSGVFIPEDIIVREILIRLSVKSLLRFKCISKSWYVLFSSPGFINSHLQHSKKNPKPLITSFVRNLSPISMYAYNHCTSSRQARFMFAKELSPPIDVLWLPPHSNGLVLLHTAVEVIICNPSTREYTPLPKGSNNARIWPDEDGRLWGANRTGFGFVSSTNTYKLGQYFYRSCDLESGTWSIGFEVFTLGVDSQWRATEDELLYPVEGSTPESLGESIYFRIDKTLDTTLPPELCYFSFHLVDEKFRTVNLPSSFLLGDHKLRGFAQLDSDTCFYTISNDGTTLDMWVNNGCSTSNNSWTHIFNIDLSRPVHRLYPVTMYDGSLLIRTKVDGRSKLERYNHRSGSLEAEVDLGTDLAYYIPHKCSLIWLRDSVFHLSSYVESLLPTN